MVIGSAGTRLPSGSKMSSCSLVLISQLEAIMNPNLCHQRFGNTHHEETRLSAKLDAEWRLDTAYLQQLKVTHRARACAAVRWRRRFLQALRTSCSVMFAVKAAKVSYNTVRAHQASDPEFAGQVREAEEEGAQLLHDAAWKAAVEGEIEPLYWNGEIVGHVRKFDSRLRIEMLRAHLPHRFKTPGQASVSINAPGANVLVIGPEEQAELASNRRRYLESIRAKEQAPPLVESPQLELRAKEGHGQPLG